jgi:hypothetical protein
MYPPDLHAVILGASDRLYARFDALPPYLASRSRKWLDTFTKGHRLEVAVEAPLSFPLVLVPWWAEEALTGGHDPGFQAELVYSAVAMYLFIRLLDDVMDDDGTADPQLLPLAGVLHQEMQSAFAAMFPPESPFWAHFQKLWDASAAVTVWDADALTISEDEFLRMAGLKCLAAGIQAGAVCLRAGRPEAVVPWQTLVEALSTWHQFGHDLFDWKKDEESGITTFFLCEAQRRRHPEETLDGWVFREGFAWGQEYLGALTRRLRQVADPLGSPGLDGYLDHREALQNQRFEELEKGLALARTLFGLDP